MIVLRPGQLISFYYTNHRDLFEERKVIFLGLDYGHNEWYPENQWFMRCWDTNRTAYRSFALAKIEIESLKAYN